MIKGAFGCLGSSNDIFYGRVIISFFVKQIPCSLYDPALCRLSFPWYRYQSFLEILLKKYPNIKFIYNEKYNEANNISSAYLVRDKFANSYVLESDLYLYNSNLIRKYEYHSNFLGFKVDRSDDWCLDTKNGIITREKIGGTNCYQMCGISYYDNNDGRKMKDDIKEVFDSPGGKEKYWEQVMLDIKKSDYKIYLRECQKDDIIEIDTFNELKAIDKTYDV